MAQRENTPPARISEQQAYVQALRTRGAKPSDQVRPSFGNLEPTIRLIEEVAEKSNGHIGAIERTITTLQRTNPALAVLLEIHRSDAKTTEVTESAFQVSPLPEGIAFARRDQAREPVPGLISTSNTAERSPLRDMTTSTLPVACGCSRQSLQDECMFPFPNGSTLPWLLP